MLDVDYNDSFEYFIFKCQERYAIIYGGAGSGKSFAVAQKIIHRCLNRREHHRFLVVRKLKNTIEESVFSLIRSLIIDYGLESYCTINKTKMSFQFSKEFNNNEIITTGIDDPEKLKSIHGITSVWIEEATELDEKDERQINLRIRGETDSYKQIVMTFNPISSDHWIYKRFFDKEHRRTKGVYTMHSNFKDNFFLDKEYVQELITDYEKDPNQKRIYVDGEWGRPKLGGEFYSSFSYDRHVGMFEFNPDVPLHLSFDFNVNPYMPATIWQIISEEREINGTIKRYYDARCIDLITLENPRNKTEDLCDEFMIRYPDERVGLYIYGDASGRVKSTTSNEHNYDIIERKLSRYLINDSMRVPRRNPLIARRRNFINNIMMGKIPEINLQIHKDRAEKLIIDLESVLEDADGKKYSSRGKTSAGVPYIKYGHLSDSMDYFFTQAFYRWFEKYG